MTQTSQNVEKRIASLPIAKAEREKALAYVQTGENLADAVLALIRVFSAQSTPILSHNH
ncbi:MAG: hypothetical protein IH605_21270 [Burkholderiales bacterium]|nr:hypothetical protein [Burkholderiales bacterium]